MFHAQRAEEVRVALEHQQSVRESLLRSDESSKMRCEESQLGESCWGTGRPQER